jgi:APA family basic amino acid/polyamine antiporter
MNYQGTAELRRSIGLVKATAMVVGTIIGASIFVQPSLITGQVTTRTAVYLVWGVAGLLTLFGALVSAELASAYPRTGGVYVFLKEAFAPPLGFLWGWTMFWSMHSGIIAAIAVVFARYVGHFVPLSGLGIRVVAIAGILVLSWINYLGVKQGSVLQTAFTFAKVFAILIIIIVGFALGTPVASTASAAGAGLDPQDFGIALIAGLFAFGGWHMVTYAAGETLEPEKTIPRALLAGTLIVTVSYIALNAVYFYVLPLDAVVSSTRVAADAAAAVMGAGGAAAVSALVIVSTFGALSGIILAGPRVYYSMAADGLLFRWLGDVHPKYRTPHLAIALQAVWSSALVATGTYRALFTRVIYTEWIFFGLMALGLILLRRRPGYAPHYRVWGYPFVPAVFIVSSAIIVLNQIISDPAESAFGLSVVVLGLPVYYVWTARQHRAGG